MDLAVSADLLRFRVRLDRLWRADAVVAEVAEQAIFCRERREPQALRTVAGLVAAPQEASRARLLEDSQMPRPAQ